MKCQKFLNNLTVFADNELSGSDKLNAEAHMRNCASCAEAYAAEQKKAALISSLLPRAQENGVQDIMQHINNMPAPFMPEREASFIFKAAYTIYNSLAFGLMAAVGYFLLFTNLISFESMLYSPETLSIVFGGVFIIIGCIFILMQGREVTTWIAARMRTGFDAIQLSQDSMVSLITGLSFCVCGGIFFLTGIY